VSERGESFLTVPGVTFHGGHETLPEVTREESVPDGVHATGEGVG